MEEKKYIIEKEEKDFRSFIYMMMALGILGCLRIILLMLFAMSLDLFFLMPAVISLLCIVSICLMWVKKKIGFFMYSASAIASWVFFIINDSFVDLISSIVGYIFLLLIFLIKNNGYNAYQVLGINFPPKKSSTKI